MAELMDKDLEQVDGAGTNDIFKKIYNNQTTEGQMPGFDGQIRDIDLSSVDGGFYGPSEIRDGQIRDVDLAEVDGGVYGRQVDIDNSGIGGGQPKADGAVWIGGATNPIAGSKDGFYFDPEDSLGNPS